MKNLVAAAVLGAALTMTLPALAQGASAEQADLAALKAGAKTDKRALVTSTMQLTPDEAKAFWPIYDDYQRSLDALHRRRSVAIEELLSRPKPMSDAYAREVVKELLAIDDEELKARKTMQNKMLKKLPPKRVVRYLQLETKLRAIQAYDIAAAFPLVN